MASTDQVRDWYQETVLNHDDRGQPGYEPECNWGIAITLGFPRAGGVYNEPVHPATVEAWEAYIELMRKHDVLMPSAGGVNQCRNIGGTDWPSLHAYLVACDLPPNSYKPQVFIDDVLALRTNSGAQVFLNGVGFDDRMHDQINCSPADLATGIRLGDDMQPPDWAVPATQWHIDNNIYTEANVDEVDESEEFHRQTVFRHRMYNNVIKGQGGTKDQTARTQAKRANDRLDGIRIPD